MNDLINSLKIQGLISEEKIGFDQIAKHAGRAIKDLKVAAANLDIDCEPAYNYAYLALLRTGRALMFFYGYRPLDGQQHKTIVQFAEAVLGSDFSDLIARFDRMRKFRNKFTYEEPGILVSRQQTEEAIKVANEFVKKVTDLIKKNNPQLNLEI